MQSFNDIAGQCFRFIFNFLEGNPLFIGTIFEEFHHALLRKIKP